MKLISKVDKQSLVALSAPVGFAMLSLILYYGFKFLGSMNLPALKMLNGLELFALIPLTAVIGSYIAAKITQDLLKIKVALLRLVIGAMLGYEAGVGIEILFLREALVIKQLLFYFIFVVLLCGYLCALFGIRLGRQQE